MSIYDNDTSKIYSDVNPTGLQEPQAYRFKNIISQAIHEGDISSIQFHKIFQEVENIANLR